MRMSETGPAGIAVASQHERPIPAAAVCRLYRHVGWWPQRSEADVAQVLARGPAIGAWDDETLVGFVRAVTDGPCRAYIEDVVVQETQRRQGVGTLLLKRLLAELRHVETISIFCAADLVAFYAEHGFRPTKQVVMHRPRSSSHPE